jgi:protein O-mannosyl-transferase
MSKGHDGKKSQRPAAGYNLEALLTKTFRVPPKTLLWISLALVAANLIIYAPSWNYGFLLFDDPGYVTDNLEVSHGITAHGFGWAFVTGHSANWHPLTWLSHMLDIQIYGMQGGGHHATNLLFHIASSLLLFLIFSQATGSWGQSATVAFLFAVHPMHVESVAWVAERKDVLSTFLWMLVLCSYLRYARQPPPRRRVLIIVLFALGLMAKPMLVTLPLILLLLDVWPLGRASIERSQFRAWLLLVREKIPLFILSAASSAVTIIAQWKGGSVQGVVGLPLGGRMANALASYAIYLGKMLYPTDLIPYYPYAPVSGWLIATGALGIVLGSTVAIRSARRHPYLLVGWFWYLLTLLPVIGLIQVGAQSRADRYTYIPFIGLFIILAWGVPSLFAGIRYRAAILGASAAVLICISTALAREQAGYWKDDLALWQHALRIKPDNYFARTSLGIALAARGDLASAIEQYRESLRLKPDSAETHNALGAALFKQGLWREALPHYEEAVRLRPDFAEARSNMGTILGMQGNMDEAVSEFQAALKLAPQNAEMLYNLGFALANTGKYDAAIAQYAKALEIKPLYVEACFEMGNALFMQGKPDQAMQRYLQVLNIRPDFAQAHNNLGLALMKQGRNDEAITQFNEALHLDPNNVQAQENLATLSGK